MKAKSKEELSELRERFVIEYCKSKNWNHRELSTIQMLLITQQPKYINPL